MRLLLTFLGGSDFQVVRGGRPLLRSPPFPRSPHRRGLCGLDFQTEVSRIEPPFEKHLCFYPAQTQATNAAFGCCRACYCGRLRDLPGNECEKRKLGVLRAAAISFV